MQTKTKPKPMPITGTLCGSELAVGHCVIVNHHERCCGRLLAVITSIHGGVIWCKYLNKEPNLTSYNMYRGMRPMYQDRITPIERFGVRVRYEQECSGADVVYWCEMVGESTATYHDGRPRQWQESGWQGRYVARPKVFAVACTTATDATS